MGAASRGGRQYLGASCPFISLAPGTCVDLLDGTSVSSFGRFPEDRVPALAAPLLTTMSHEGPAMTPRKGKGFAKDVAAARRHSGMELLRPHAAGIDVHSRQHYVAVPADDVPAAWINPDPHLPVGVRIFGSNTG